MFSNRIVIIVLKKITNVVKRAAESVVAKNTPFTEYLVPQLNFPAVIIGFKAMI